MRDFPLPDDVQSYVSHKRYLPGWHFFVLPVLVLEVLHRAGIAIDDPSLHNLWMIVVVIAILAAAFFARRMSLTVQNRLVRLEERLRLNRLLGPDREHDADKFDLDQLIALRFASDDEVPHLVDRILAGELRTREEIKRAVQHWRPDHLRV